MRRGRGLGRVGRAAGRRRICPATEGFALYPLSSRPTAIPSLQPPVTGDIVHFMGSLSETYRYIQRTPGVRSGNARIEGTRIGVHDGIGLLQNGETIETVTGCFPGLTRAQVFECLAYYEDHVAEIDHLIARQMDESGS